MEEMMNNVEEMVEVETVAEVAEPAVEIIAKADMKGVALALAIGFGAGLVGKQVYKKVLEPSAKKALNKISKKDKDTKGLKHSKEDETIYEAEIKENND